MSSPTELELLQMIFSVTDNKNIVVSDDGDTMFEVGAKLKVKKEKIYIAKVAVGFYRFFLHFIFNSDWFCIRCMQICVFISLNC